MGALVKKFQKEKEDDWANKKMLDFSSWLDLLEDRELYDSLKIEADKSFEAWR
jgi:hypothetical protein